MQSLCCSLTQVNPNRLLPEKQMLARNWLNDFTSPCDFLKNMDAEEEKILESERVSIYETDGCTEDVFRACIIFNCAFSAPASLVSAFWGCILGSACGPVGSVVSGLGGCLGVGGCMCVTCTTALYGLKKTKSIQDTTVKFTSIRKLRLQNKKAQIDCEMKKTKDQNVLQQLTTVREVFDKAIKMW